jgi:Ca2+-transporting ATPase
MENNSNESGLTDSEVLENRKIHGSNKLTLKEDYIFLNILKDLVREPMLIILILSSIIYYWLGQKNESVIMLISVLLVASISFYQEYKSKNAISALKKISNPKVKVKRNNFILFVSDDEIVVNDLIILNEGEIIAADCSIISSNDFSVNESILTGETFPLSKIKNEHVYKGTLVTSGSAVVKVDTVGLKTMFGKIGISLEQINSSLSPLQLKINRFVKKMIVLGLLAFLIIVFARYTQTGMIVTSILVGLSLAMSIFPEEIPVALSTFHALGAYKLLKLYNIIVKQPKYVETLGEASVICIDKTGTITKNEMIISNLYEFNSNSFFDTNSLNVSPDLLIEYAMWSSEINPFDPMEKSIHNLYQKTSKSDKRNQYKQVHEYPLIGKPPLMTHIFNNNNDVIIAAKGAPESILNQSNLSDYDKNKVMSIVREYAKNGFRILGVGKGIWTEKKWPVSQSEFTYDFLGLIMFKDPPKENINKTIEIFKQAGIRVLMITGDYSQTAISIANKTGLSITDKCLEGEDVIKMSDQELREKVKIYEVYSRMFPEAKLKIIEALKDNGDVVAMTGDGVNDAPALKAADIGISMGQRGSEVAKSAADLILNDDDLYHMTEAIALGRNIYNNFKNAIRYIISIHIPIILLVLLPILLNWKFSVLFYPVHVIFFEIIMGPTCSIVYENEPIEAGIMNKKPNLQSKDFLTSQQLLISVVQGLAITFGCIAIGYYFIQNGSDESLVRTTVFVTLMFSNIFITLINRSTKYSIFTSILYKNNLLYVIIIITFSLTISFIFIPQLRILFQLSHLSFQHLMICFVAAFVSTFWIEPFKKLKRK